MNEYHKIQNVFKRDVANGGKRLLIGEWSMPEFGYLGGNQWVFTEKVDGTNIRIMWNGSSLSFGGKTNNAQLPSKLVERLRERFPTADMFRSTFDCGNVCLYGEGYGPGIQKAGGSYRSDQDFVLFDVKIGDWWLNREDVEDIGSKLGLDVVPVIGGGTLLDCVDRVKCGIQSQWGDFQAEGIVARPAMELRTRGGLRIITKVKHKDFQ